MRCGIKRKVIAILTVLSCLLLVPITESARAQDTSRIMVQGRNAMRRGDYEKAREYFRQAQSLSTRGHSIADAILHEGESYMTEGEYDQALDVFKQVADIPEINDHAHTRARLIQAQLGIARAYAKKGDHVQAAVIFDTIPDMLDVSPDVASDAILQAGQQYAAQGQTTEALDRFDMVVAKTDNPAHHRSRALLEIAVIHTRNNDKKAALSAYTKVIEKPGPGIPVRHRALARLESEKLQYPAESEKTCTLNVSELFSGKNDSEPAWPPRSWTAFGPVMPFTHGQEGVPDPRELVAPETLTAIPAKLQIGEETFTAQQVVFDEHLLDLGAIFNGVQRGKLVYLFAAVESASDMVVRMGASADWWMQWWLNGEPVYDTLKTGNRSADFTVADHIFEMPLCAGHNVITVAVISGSGNFLIVVGDPGEMDRAMEYFEQGNFEQAAPLFADVIELKGVSPHIQFEARLNLGVCLRKLGCPTEALKVYNGIKDMPGAPAYYNSRALLEIAATHTAMGNIEQAVSAYRQVMAMRGIPIRHIALARLELQRITQKDTK